MAKPTRKIAFILAATNHGTLIVNRMDYHASGPTSAHGVGLSLLDSATYEAAEGTVAMQLLAFRRQYFGDGVVVVDCGANIGVHTVEWATEMTGWGRVIAIEAQERIFYALAGNIAINNCFNASAIHAAVGAEQGSLCIPTPNYSAPANFGGLELRQSTDNEFIGQAIDYADLVEIQAMTIDSLNLMRLDLLKIDVERMEIEVLQGAAQTVERTRPIIIVENMKTPGADITEILGSYGYKWYQLGLNFLAVHPSDATGNHIQVAQTAAPQ